MQKVIGIDPGLTGAFVLTDGEGYFAHWAMPFSGEGRERRIEFGEAVRILYSATRLGAKRIFIERPVSFGMSTNSAYSYGRGFEAILIAIEISKLPYTLIEPAKWTKAMHEGISADLKPKAKSLIAVKRLFPKLVGELPTKPKGGLHDGPVDALLIAGYGLRRIQGSEPNHGPLNARLNGASNQGVNPDLPKKQTLPSLPALPVKAKKSRHSLVNSVKSVNVEKAENRSKSAKRYKIVKIGKNDDFY